MEKWIILVLAVALVLSLTGCAGGTTPAETTVHLQQEKTEDTITVTGRMGLEVTPDVARVSIGVSTQASTPGTAREQNSVAVNATLAALAELGIEEKDIQTSNINLWNRYDSNSNIIGYRMSTDLTIYVREIEKAGEVVDAAIAAGSNELNGVEYLVSNQDELYNQALTEAIDLAWKKAEALAAAAGKTLVEVKQVDETSRAVATVQEYATNADTGSDSARSKSTTIRPGSTTISAEVQVIFRAE